MSDRIPARPTVYNGIRMRSRLEAAFAATLDRTPFSWSYEPQAFGARGRRQYLPDFRVEMKTGVVWIEVKPTVEDAFIAMERMSVIWLNDPDANLAVTTPDLTWFSTEDHQWVVEPVRWRYL